MNLIKKKKKRTGATQALNLPFFYIIYTEKKANTLFKEHALNLTGVFKQH